MNKKKLEDLKRRLIALGLAGVLISTTGCEKTKSKTAVYNSSPSSEISLGKEIPSKYSRSNNYYSIVVRDGKNLKLYNSKNICLFIDKETYEVSEYLYNNNVSVFGGLELYDLESEIMYVYSDGICINYNLDYYKDLIDNSYRVYFNDLDNYISDIVPDGYYSLEDIRRIEGTIVEQLKENEVVKGNVKVRYYKFGGTL